MMCVITTMITFFLSKLQCAMYLGTISDDERLMNFIISTATCVHPVVRKERKNKITVKNEDNKLVYLFIGHTCNGLHVTTVAAVRPSMDSGVTSFCVNQTGRV